MFTFRFIIVIIIVGFPCKNWHKRVCIYHSMDKNYNLNWFFSRDIFIFLFFSFWLKCLTQTLAFICMLTFAFMCMLIWDIKLNTFNFFSNTQTRNTIQFKSFFFWLLFFYIKSKNEVQIYAVCVFCVLILISCMYICSIF